MASGMTVTVIENLDELLAQYQRMFEAIMGTAAQGTYDEIAIRKAVSFELAELIVGAHRAIN